MPVTALRGRPERVESSACVRPFFATAFNTETKALDDAVGVCMTKTYDGGEMPE